MHQGLHCTDGLHASAGTNPGANFMTIMHMVGTHHHPLQVRATSLQELVYKQGQAGITKASVSITFHNNDPRSGPAGYEDKEYITVTRTIVIGGRNKYTINGHAVLEGKVQVRVRGQLFSVGMFGRMAKEQHHTLGRVRACRARQEGSAGNGALPGQD